MKKILLYIIILFFAVPSYVFGQDGWIKEFLGPGNEYAGELINTSDGNYLLPLSADEGLGTNIDTGSYLIKLDINGDFLWMHKYDTIPYGFSGAPRVIEAADNGFLVLQRKAYTNGVFQPFFTKLDADGNEEWSQFFLWGGTVAANNNIHNFVLSSDGNYLLTGGDNDAGSPLTHVRKLDPNFNEIWAYEAASAFRGWTIKELPNSDIITGGGNSLIIKLDSDGNEIWINDIPDIYPSFSNIFLMPDGSMIGFAADTGNPPPNNPPLQQFKLDSQGDLIWEIELPFQVAGGALYKVVQADDGLFLGSQIGVNNNPLDAFSTYLFKVDNEGNIIWENEVNYIIGPSAERTISIVPTPDNGIIGVSFNSSSAGVGCYVYKTDSLGFIYRNQVIGNIARDEQPNCAIDSLENNLSGWVVSATNPTNTFYGVTDTTGTYQIQIDTGDYVLSIHPPNLIWETCENDIDISINNNTPITEQDFPMEAVVDCPLLVVSSNLFAARPCFDNNQYAVSYCNEGTVTADNAYIDIEVEDDLTYVSSSINLTSQNGNIYTFDLGDIASGECGNFKVYFMVDCEATIGASTCITSHIYPDSFCVVDPNWDGAFVEIDVECNEDQVNFYLENIGNADMPTTKEYIVVEDAILIMMNNFQLLTGQTDSFSIPANGSTFTLLAEQVENAPGDAFLSAWVEACGINGSGSFSLGYINQFSLGDNVPYVDTDCRVISSSFDPNDKQGFPLGYGNEHFIRPNTDIEYKIRFQNTGTDTAFTVVIRDTLKAELDIPSIHAGASSHPYSWRLYGENILEFTFNSIMLPDSNINEPASHGFVEFNISQQPNLPDGTVINNKAGIYFDYNEPIITNETFHTIGLNFITVSLQNPLQEENRIQVYPNPLQDFAIFEMKKELKNGVIEVYDLSGKLAWEEKFSGKQFQLKRNDLKSGFYFYKITAEGQVINSGKIVVQ